MTQTVCVHSLHRWVVTMRVVLVCFALYRFRVVKWKCFIACSPAFTSCMLMFATASCSTSWRPTACFVRMMIWCVIFNSNTVGHFESLWRVFLYEHWLKQTSWDLFSIILLHILQMKSTCQLYHVSCLISPNDQIPVDLLCSCDRIQVCLCALRGLPCLCRRLLEFPAASRQSAVLLAKPLHPAGSQWASWDPC